MSSFDFDEDVLLATLSRELAPLSGRGSVGIGDDAAVLPAPALGSRVVATVDALVEGVHFLRDYASAEDIGHKLLAVNLSDLAAMGATPQYALVSLALTPKVDAAWVGDLYRGLAALASRFGVAVAGGNLTRAKDQLFLDLTLLGAHAGKPKLRSGARVGDRIYVTGTLGRAAGGLAALRRFGREAAAMAPVSVAAQVRPEPRVTAGLWLGSHEGVTAMMDISDGLSRDAGRLAAASRVRLAIEPARIPVDPELRALAHRLAEDPVQWPLRCAQSGGEDYELLFCADPASAAAVERGLEEIGIPGTCIGAVTSGEGTSLGAGGWDSFRNGSA